MALPDDFTEKVRMCLVEAGCREPLFREVLPDGMPVFDAGNVTLFQAWRACVLSSPTIAVCWDCTKDQGWGDAVDYDAGEQEISCGHPVDPFFESRGLMV